MEQSVVLITGANKGIGFEIARQLGNQGFYVLLSARNQQRGEQAFDRLRQQGIEGAFIQMDVSQPESIKEAYEKIKKLTGKLDVLINNAAILLDDNIPLLELDAEQSIRTLQTNALGPLWVTQSFQSMMSAGGRVIMISSRSGAFCSGFSTWAPMYAISKVSLNAITRQLHPILQSKDISINAMCPGWVQTDMGGSGASRTVGKGAETAVWLATVAPADLTGNFVRDKQEISW